MDYSPFVIFAKQMPEKQAMQREMKKKDTPLGTSNFKLLIEENRYYVDKTMLVSHVLKSNQITLLCRPRRFGKTLNLNMLRRFFSNDEDNRHLFEGLNISRDEESMTHQGRYPVIFLSFKDAKQEELEMMLDSLRYSLVQAWKDHRYLAKDPEIGEEYLQELRKLEDPQTKINLITPCLQKLTELLYRHSQTLVILLIDEYDTPVQSAWLNHFYDKIVAFLRPLFGAAMKDNDYLKKGVLTGILRVAKESMFSDLNNFIASTVLDSDVFSDQFGFTEEEVLEMFRHYDMNGQEINELHEWYDGYRFGDERIYNPWSVLNYVFSLKHQLKPYWVNTSQDSLLRRLFFNEKSGIRNFIEDLLRGDKIPARLSPHLVFQELSNNKEAVWTMLVMAGYLKAENWRDKNQYDVSIPNKEIQSAFTDSILGWLRNEFKTDTRQDMLDALAAGRVKDFELYLSDFVMQVFSYYDTTKRFSENFYHAFFLGLFAGTEDQYTLRSNREEGYGRYDICLIPKDPTQRGIVIEIKSPDTKEKETLATALQAAKDQLSLNKYDAGLREAGVSQLLRLAIAVQGKRVKLEAVPA